MTPGLELPLLTLALLVLASFLAGWIDAVVGGGGLIQLPALLIGLPPDTPVATIAGTNKLPSFMGTLTASLTYLRTIKVDWGWRGRCWSPRRSGRGRGRSSPTFCPGSTSRRWCCSPW